MTKKIIDGKGFSVFIEILVIISVVALPIETLAGIPERLKYLLFSLEIFVVIIFFAEYVARIMVEDNKRKYILSARGVVDLVSFLPLMFVGFDLRFVRIFRLTKVLRVLDKDGYESIIKRFKMAFIDVYKEIVVFFVLSLFLIYVSGVVIYFAEHHAQPDKFRNIFDGMWWSVITLTTTGYGDVLPITIIGKIFTVFDLIIGIGILIVPSSLLVQSFHNINKNERTTDRRNRVRKENPNHHFRCEPYRKRRYFFVGVTHKYIRQGNIHFHCGRYIANNMDSETRSYKK